MQGLLDLQDAQENIPQRTPVVQILVDAGADVDGTLPGTTTTTANTTNSTTPLMCAAELGHCHVVRCLLEAGADINARDVTGGTALIKAASLGRTQCIEILLNHTSNVDIDAVDRYGVSAVLAAVAAGQLETLWTLLVAGANPNCGARSSDGCSALHIAAASGRAPLVSALLSFNADVNAVTKKGETPVFLAAQLGKTEAVAVLVKNQKCPSPLAKTDNRGYTPLMSALENQHVEAAIAICAAHSKQDIGVNVADRRDGTTAMSLALALGGPGECIVYRLMVAGADPYGLAGNRAPTYMQRGSSSSVEQEPAEAGLAAEGAPGPIPAVKALAEGVTHGTVGADELIPQFL
jgi:ankyrin repeat protein